ncbi:MAG: hypothetical protein AMXMBFR84_17820 [Candidatus Hydrogenedentota bacterium]
MADQKKPGNRPDNTDDFGTADVGDSDFGALTGDESGLGNLPPLSDFESSAGGDFDSGLPPLSGIDTPGPDRARDSVGGLPPISDIPVDTPMPTGGAIRPKPAGFSDSPAFETPGSGSAFDTPSGSHFQDLAADSDFTPETPELAPPGPESDIDTPMFDSAFGGGTDFGDTSDTSAPTQAMETPMFGVDDEPGFDADAFGAGMGGVQVRAQQGTPMPDFSPDTGAPTHSPMAPMAPAGGGKSKGGGGGLLVGVGLGVVGLIAGIVASPFLANTLSFLPNPQLTKIGELEQDIDQKDQQITRLTQMESTGQAAGISPEDMDKLITQKEELVSSIEQLNTQRTDVQTSLDTLSADRDNVQKDLDALNAQFAQAQSDYEELVNQTAIVTARRDGLTAEVDRLEGLTGRLEDANQRRAMTLAALVSDLEELEVLIREGSPLTPPSYSREARITRIQDLKGKAQSAKWVDPALLDEYTNMYLDELKIAGTREYFYAKIPVRDRFGTPSEQWAECLMNGNWSVYYRTLDGKHIGVFENLAMEGTPNYGFNEKLPKEVQLRIEQEVFAKRPVGFEQQLVQLAGKQNVQDEKSDMQRLYDSL